MSPCYKEKYRRYLEPTRSQDTQLTSDITYYNSSIKNLDTSSTGKKRVLEHSWRKHTTETYLSLSSEVHDIWLSYTIISWQQINHKKYFTTLQHSIPSCVFFYNLQLLALSTDIAISSMYTQETAGSTKPSLICPLKE